MVNKKHSLNMKIEQTIVANSSKTEENYKTNLPIHHELILSLKVSHSPPALSSLAHYKTSPSPRFNCCKWKGITFLIPSTYHFPTRRPNSKQNDNIRRFPRIWSLFDCWIVGTRSCHRSAHWFFPLPELLQGSRHSRWRAPGLLRHLSGDDK